MGFGRRSRALIRRSSGWAIHREPHARASIPSRLGRYKPQLLRRSRLRELRDQTGSDDARLRRAWRGQEAAEGRHGRPHDRACCQSLQDRGRKRRHPVGLCLPLRCGFRFDHRPAGSYRGRLFRGRSELELFTSGVGTRKAPSPRRCYTANGRQRGSTSRRSSLLRRGACATSWGRPPRHSMLREKRSRPKPTWRRRLPAPGPTRSSTCAITGSISYKTSVPAGTSSMALWRAIPTRKRRPLPASSG